MIRSYRDYLAEQPANTDSDLLRNCASWWMAYPVSNFGGSKLFDLMPKSSFGGGNNGTLVGVPVWQGGSGRPGGTGTLVYNGTSSQVQFTPINIPNGITYTAWYYTSIGTGDHAIVCNKATLFTWNAGNYNWWTNTSIGSVSAASGASVGKWHHATVTCTADGAYAIYTNGIQVGSGTTNAVSNNTDNNSNRIGLYVFGNRFWNGGLDDVRVYTSPLTADQVFRVYEDSLRGYPATLRRVRSAAYSLPDVNPQVQSAFNAAWMLNCNKLLGGGVY